MGMIENFEKMTEKEREDILTKESVIVATCSCCGHLGAYQMSDEEAQKYVMYSFLGRDMGFIQDIFPNIPAWIRSGCIDQYSNGFCICPACCG